MKTRRMPAEVLRAEKAAILARIEALKGKLDVVDEKLSPEEEEELRETHRFLGEVVSKILPDDAGLKVRMNRQASSMFPKSKRAQKLLAKSLGPLVVEDVAILPAKNAEAEAAKPAPASDDSDLGDYKPSRDYGDKLAAAE